MKQPTEHGQAPDMTGWPAVPPTELIERAQQLLIAADFDPNNVSNEDDRKAAACFLLSRAAPLLSQDLQPQLDALPDDAQDALTSLMSLLRQKDILHMFGGALFTQAPGEPPGTARLAAVFGVVRHPLWMGLSPYYPLLKDSRVLIYQSTTYPDSIGTFLAVPACMPPPGPPEPAIPQGDPSTFNEILAWHGAVSTHWFPA